MSSDNEEDAEKKRQFPKLCIPEEVRLKYFPQMVTKFAYDVLPLFEVDDYRKKTMHEVSFLENPTYAEKWEKFRAGLPESASNLKPPCLTSHKTPIFANYRRQKVPPEYFTAYKVPPSSEPIFRKEK